MKVFLYFIGKPRDVHSNAMAAEYVKRTNRYAECVMREITPNRFDPFEKHPSASKILLDPEGRRFDSGQFSETFRKAELVGQDLVFLVGGHDGFPAGWNERADLRLSLSPLTFPHELARTVLAEQIYRAFTILRGHPYPR